MLVTVPGGAISPRAQTLERERTTVVKAVPSANGIPFFFHGPALSASCPLPTSSWISEYSICLGNIIESSQAAPQHLSAWEAIAFAVQESA